MLKLINNKSFMRIFIVLLTVFILMFLLNYIFLKRSMHLMDEQVKDNNRLVASNMIQFFDNSFQGIYNLVYSIDILPYRYTADKSEEQFNNFLIYKSLNKLVTSSSLGEYIEEIVVYNENAKSAITPIGTIDADTIFNTYFINDQYNSLYWDTFFKENHSLKIFPARDYTELLSRGRKRERNLIVVAGKIHQSLNNLVIFVDARKLLKAVEENKIEGSSFVILDPDNNVILNTDEDINLIDVVSEIHVGEGQEKIVNNQENEYTMFKSDYNGFTYIYRMPYEGAAITSIATYHRTTTIISAIFALILAFLLSVYLFRPNIRLKKLIGGNYSWDHIHHTILRLKQDKDYYEHEVTVVESEMRQQAFADVISGNKLGKDLQVKITSYVNEYLTEQQFLLVNFSIMAKTEDLTAPLKIARSLKESITNELNIDKKIVFHTKENELLLLIGIHAPKDRSKIVQTLKNFTKTIDQKYKDLLTTCHLTLSISQAYDANIDHLRKAYQTVVDIPFYRNVDHKTSLYDVAAVRNTTEVYYPTEEVDKLSNLLISGNDQEALVIIDEIIHKNIELKIQYYQFTTVLQSLVLSMKRHLNFSDEKQETMHELELVLFNHIRQGVNFEQVEKSFMKIVTFISKKVIQDKESKLNRTFIVQYIELHFMDGLYLEHMASVTNTSPKYFSKYFKNTFGVNFIEYLNHVRINHAKEFLKNKNITVSEIGEKTGFMHATTFSSTFKRITGITPTQYRNKYVGRED